MLRSRYGSYTDWPMIGMICGGVFLVALLIGIVIWSSNDIEEWKNWCNTEAHGHWIDHTSTATTFVNGKSGVTTETTYYCLNEAGGIIDIYG